MTDGDLGPEPVARRHSIPVARIAASVLAIVSAALVGRALEFNPTTFGLVLLVVVLFISAWNGTAIGVGAAILATALFNYFVLPPIGTWRIDAIENWVSLASFLAVSVFVSQLVLRARREAAAAEERRSALERLYGLSVDLFGAANRPDALDVTTRRAMEAAGTGEGGLVLFEGSSYRQRREVWYGQAEDGVEDLIAGVGRHCRSLEVETASRRAVYLPLALGGRPIGVLALENPRGDLGALESIASLLATAVERERLIRENAHIVALQESEALKTALLRAVSHDLTTPLTAIALNIERLRRHVADDDDGRAALESLEDETTRLQRRISGLLAYARLEAGALQPRAEPAPVADLVRSAREHLPFSRERRFDIHIDLDGPDVMADPSFAVEILVNLIENADRSSPPGEPIEIVAEGLEGDRVRIEIRDRGPGMAPLAPPRSDGRDTTPVETTRRGLGLEIAAGLAAASGGAVSILDRPGGGVIARVDLPAAPSLAREAQP